MRVVNMCAREKREAAGGVCMRARCGPAYCGAARLARFHASCWRSRPLCMIKVGKRHHSRSMREWYINNYRPTFGKPRAFPPSQLQGEDKNKPSLPKHRQKFEIKHNNKERSRLGSKCHRSPHYYLDQALTATISQYGKHRIQSRRPADSRCRSRCLCSHPGSAHRPSPAPW